MEQKTIQEFLKALSFQSLMDFAYLTEAKTFDDESPVREVINRYELAPDFQTGLLTLRHCILSEIVNKKIKAINRSELKRGMIVRRILGPETMPGRCWIVLEVTQQDIDKGANTDEPGLHGFGGLWYGERTNDDPTNTDSYGKITWFDEEDMFEVIEEDIANVPFERIKELCA